MGGVACELRSPLPACRPWGMIPQTQETQLFTGILRACYEGKVPLVYIRSSSSI